MVAMETILIWFCGQTLGVSFRGTTPSPNIKRWMWVYLRPQDRQLCFKCNVLELNFMANDCKLWQKPKNMWWDRRNGTFLLQYHVRLIRAQNNNIDFWRHEKWCIWYASMYWKIQTFFQSNFRFVNVAEVVFYECGQFQSDWNNNKRCAGVLFWQTPQKSATSGVRCVHNTIWVKHEFLMDLL